MTTRKNFWWWVTDATLLVPNTIGGVLNVVPNTLQGVRNSGNTAGNVIKSMSSRIADAFTYKPFDYEKLEKYVAGSGFMQKWKTMFWNAWKGIKNTPRFAGNVIKQLGWWIIATGIYGTGMLVWAPIWAAATLVKNTTQSVAGGVIDPMNSILKIWQQWVDDKWLAFTNVEKSNTVSYTDYAKRITDTRASKKAERAEIRAAKKAIKAKYANWWTPSPAPTPEPKKEEHKDSDESDKKKA
jgi:hypothetical protein